MQTQKMIVVCEEELEKTRHWKMNTANAAVMMWAECLALQREKQKATSVMNSAKEECGCLRVW